MFEWFRAIHIIAVIAWMAGLLIYPRLLVYRLEAQGDERFEAAMDKAADSTRTPVIADGGIKFSGDFAKALAAGASLNTGMSPRV